MRSSLDRITISTSNPWSKRVSGAFWDFWASDCRWWKPRVWKVVFFHNTGFNTLGNRTSITWKLSKNGCFIWVSCEHVVWCWVVGFSGFFELLQILVNTFCAIIWYRNSAHSSAPEIIQNDFRGKWWTESGMTAMFPMISQGLLYYTHIVLYIHRNFKDQLCPRVLGN